MGRLTLQEVAWLEERTEPLVSEVLLSLNAIAQEEKRAVVVKEAQETVATNETNDAENKSDVRLSFYPGRVKNPTVDVHGFFAPASSEAGLIAKIGRTLDLPLPPIVATNTLRTLLGKEPIPLTNDDGAVCLVERIRDIVDKTPYTFSEESLAFKRIKSMFGAEQ